MTETVTCPSCQQPLRVPGELLGRDVRCPACSSVFAAGPASRSPAPWEEGPEGYADWERPRSTGASRERFTSRFEDEERMLTRRPSYRSPAREEADEGYPDGEPGRHLRPHRGTLILTLGILG